MRVRGEEKGSARGGRDSGSPSTVSFRAVGSCANQGNSYHGGTPFCAVVLVDLATRTMMTTRTKTRTASTRRRPEWSSRL